MKRREFLVAAPAGVMLAGSAACATHPLAASSDVVGGVAPEFEPVRDAFLEAQSGDAGGAQLCIYQRGRRVVDIWTGNDTLKERPYSADSVAMLMSATKGVLAIIANMLIERGQLDPASPAAHYWPEFAAEGKQDIPVAYLLSHKAGLPTFPTGFSPYDMFNWEKATSTLAAMKPAWRPGSAVQYHSVTFGYLVGEVIRRISGKSPGEFVAQDLAQPLDLALWIGQLPETAEAHFAPQFDPPPNPLSQQNALLNSPQAHLAEVPAVNGISDARSLARLYAATIGPVGGIRLLDEASVMRACTDQTVGLSAPGSQVPAIAHYGLGFNLPREANPMLGEGSFGHAGTGGRLGFAHPPTGIALAYVCNNMAWDMVGDTTLVSDPRWSFLNALRRIVGV